MTSIATEIRRLQGLNVGELRTEWERLYGEPTRSRNKDYLWRRLAWRVQELAHGGLSDVAKARIAELTPVAFTRARVPNGFDPGASSPTSPKTRRDPRLPRPGSVISREYRGRELRLLVKDDGFELDGVHHTSLSEAARAATGAHWNGLLFWGLRERRR